MNEFQFWGWISPVVAAINYCNNIKTKWKKFKTSLYYSIIKAGSPLDLNCKKSIKKKYSSWTEISQYDIMILIIIK